jgi:superfamily II DNA or RNA helicase
VKLRPYQQACIEAVKSRLASCSSTLVEAATGTGKTVMFAHLAKDWPGRVLIVVHRDELIRQAAEKVLAVTGREAGIEMGDERIDERGLVERPKVVLASVQTMSRPERQAKFRPEEFGLVVIDEAHHAVAASYCAVIARFRRNPSCKLLGVTATPKRADEIALGQIFETVAFRYPIVQAVDDGWLVPVSQQVIKVEGLDFSSVHDVAGDFNEGELDQILSEETILHRVAAPLVEEAGDRSTLIFCCSVKHAELMATVLNRYKPLSARWLSGESSREERRATVNAYRKGDVQFRVTADCFWRASTPP